jgi:hypothetical protein
VSIAHNDPASHVLRGVQLYGDDLVVRPGSACFVDTTSNPRTGRSLVTERGSLLRGIAVNASRPVFESDTSATFAVTYYQHFLSAGDWSCTARRRNKRWVVHVCDLTRIS